MYVPKAPHYVVGPSLEERFPSGNLLYQAKRWEPGLRVEFFMKQVDGWEWSGSFCVSWDGWNKLKEDHSNENFDETYLSDERYVPGPIELPTAEMLETRRQNLLMVEHTNQRSIVDTQLDMTLVAGNDG